MKGKYAAKAALRREDAGIRSEIESYQHHVKRLTTENEKLRADLAAARAEHKTEVRRLKAQLDEGLSPEVLALREELERQRERAGSAEAKERSLLEKWQGLIHLTAKLLHDATGCTGLEATERIMRALNGGAGPAHIGGKGIGDESGTRTTEQIMSLQRVRGYRSSAKVVAQLDAVVEAALGTDAQ